MIQTHSNDPDVAEAANVAAEIVEKALAKLPKASSFDYGGHILHLGDYNLCLRCSTPIAEAQQAAEKLSKIAESLEDETVKEHLELAVQLFKSEAEAARIRAEFHNGHGSEKILNIMLGFMHERQINDSYDHSHDRGN
jgi:tRNA/tmRNA/rRNA uracil-C5-methylase (TrmA/RlmC/RlmD family)